MNNKAGTNSDKIVIWFSRVLRWTLGLVFIGLGYKYYNEKNTWVMLVFGLIFIITGFLKPKRCMDDSCNI